MKIDLLGDGEDGVGGPPAAAIRIARQKFGEQLSKAGLPLAYIREASLMLARSPTQSTGLVNGQMAVGYQITFTARAVSDLGGVYESEASVFAAPHDPQVELRSRRR